jgi:hypothetical protein
VATLCSASGKAVGRMSGSEERASRRVMDALAWMSLIPKLATFGSRCRGEHVRGRSSSYNMLSARFASGA